MTDLLLYLWRMTGRIQNNAFALADSKRGSGGPSQEEVFAPYTGSMDRFSMRVITNPSLALLSVNFQVNGVIQRTITIDNIGDTGTFLPTNQLPLFFEKNDLLVMQVTGVSAGTFPIYEIDCDFKFIIV